MKIQFVLVSVKRLEVSAVCDPLPRPQFKFSHLKIILNMQRVCRGETIEEIIMHDMHGEP